MLAEFALPTSISSTLIEQTRHVSGWDRASRMAFMTEFMRSQRLLWLAAIGNVIQSSGPRRWA